MDVRRSSFRVIWRIWREVGSSAFEGSGQTHYGPVTAHFDPGPACTAKNNLKSLPLLRAHKASPGLGWCFCKILAYFRLAQYEQIMQLELIGPHPFAKDERGGQATRIGTLFPGTGCFGRKSRGCTPCNGAVLSASQRGTGRQRSPTNEHRGGGGAVQQLAGPDFRSRPYSNPPEQGADGGYVCRG